MDKTHASVRRWDIFCSVVDNFGDIGICWRLARQLVAEHGQQVRLWVDDLVSFQRLAAAIDPSLGQQWLLGVEVRRWRSPFPALPLKEIPEVVIEALACTLPASYQQAMAAKTVKPLWLNLEYLSAESWVNDCHRMASPQPSLPLTKYFFFPGFAPQTGGLLREAELLEQVAEFQQDLAACNSFWSQLGLPSANDTELRISLFAYGCRELAELVTVWSEGELPIRCLLPEGWLAQQFAEQLGGGRGAAGERYHRGNLTVDVFPFLDQEDYDRLLWGCDLNFVRGEDSFVRAQWAQRPMVWQPYRQEEAHHEVKLEAFLEHYLEGLDEPAAHALVTFWRAWNREEGLAAACEPFINQRETLAEHARHWALRQAQHNDLASNLVIFSQNPL